MNPSDTSAIQEVIWGSLAVLLGTLAWLFRKLRSARPSNGERKAEADLLRREIRLALAKDENFIALRQKLEEIQDTSDDTSAKVRHMRSAVTDLQLRLKELEQKS